MIILGLDSLDFVVCYRVVDFEEVDQSLLRLINAFDVNPVVTVLLE